MKKSKLALLSILTFVITVFSSCSDTTVCTTNIVYLKLNVVGDTLRAEEGPYMNPNGGYDYCIIANPFGSKIQGDIEKILFIGMIDEMIVISEEYRLAKGECGFRVLSGKEKVTLGTPEE
jgi:hypothetical protein